VSLTDDDEFPHTLPGAVPDGWQENYFVLGWDDDRRAGFYLHIERLAAEETVEVKAAVLTPNTIASFAHVHDLAPRLSVPGLTIDVPEPFRRWRVGLHGVGARGRAPGGFVAVDDEGDTPIGLDLTLASGLPPVDWRAALAGLPVPGTEKDHYEVPGTWSGELAAGEDRIEASGLFLRDHTWGVRDYSTFPSAWWVPTCFEDGSLYVTGVSVQYEGRWRGVGIVADDTGTRIAPGFELEAAGHLAPEGYHATVVEMQPDGGDRIRMESTTRVHVPVHFPRFAHARFCNEAFSRVQWNGREGFGIRELSGDLVHEHVEALSRLREDRR